MKSACPIPWVSIPASHTEIQTLPEAIGQMDQVTQQNAALVEEMAAAASSLNCQAQALVQIVAVFKLEVADHGPMVKQRVLAPQPKLFGTASYS